MKKVNTKRFTVVTAVLAAALVHNASGADFIARGGRIPAPMQSLKN